MSAPYAIRPASLDDVPSMAQIAADAFLTDRNTMIKAAGPEGYSRRQTMLDMLPGWIKMRDDGRGWSYIAVTSEGEIAGCVCWGRAGYKPPAKPDAPVEEPKSDAYWDAKEEEARNGEDRLGRLGAITSTNLARWIDQRLIPKPGSGKRCIFVTSIVVAPAHEGRGVGYMLVKTGMEHADEDGVNIWVQASEKAFHLFKKQGFEVLGELDVDLDEYAITPPPNGEEKWGHYVFRYMNRQSP
ncbi:Acyl-CoA N-acyltransferase [Mycena kentingensis (nom. inval.)]|nr:Acyl-CoA N-acyltransferase [Mycena kentingensis (nom. inval.)]